MNTYNFLLSLGIGILTALNTFAQNLEQIEKLLSESVNYQYGQSREKLSAVEELIRKTTDQNERRKIEQIFARMLLTPNSTLEFKEFICRHLWYLGTAQSVEAIATLFTNENTVSWACYALVRNPSREAENALINALKIVPQNTQSRLAVISALGQRRAESAAPILSQLIQDKDSQISDSAITALGLIGNEQSANILLKLYDSGNASIKEKSASALISCADILSKNGKKNVALDIYNKLFSSSESLAIKKAAITGIVENSGEKSVDFLVKILSSDNPQLYSAAIGAVNLLKESQSLKELANSIPGLSPAVQPLLINILADKREKGILPIAKKLIESPDQQIRISAITALGVIGDDSTVETLVKVISKNIEPEKKYALNSLKMLPDKRCDKEILNYLRKSDAKIQGNLINVIIERDIKESTTELLRICKSSADKNLQKIAFKALSQLGEPSIIPEIVSLILEAKDNFALEEAESAVIALANKTKDQNYSSKAILNFWQKAKTETARASLLRIIGGIGDKTALEFLNRIAFSQEQPALQDIAIRELVVWQDPVAIPVLENIYQKSQNQVHRALAFRGFIRLISSSVSTASDIKQVIHRFDQALKNAQTADEKKLTLAGLSTVSDARAIELALPMLQDDPVKMEAAQAILQISSVVWGSEPILVKNALGKVISSVDNQSFRKQAEGILKQIEESTSYITSWEVAGPYFKEGNNYDALFNIPFPPEEGNANVNWKPISAGTNPKQPYVIDLLKFFGGEQRVAYARAFIYSPEEQAAILELGSDDGVKVWLNGTLVHANNVARPITPGSDKVNIKLQKGWNRLMIKITQNNLGWEFCVRLIKPDGGVLNNIRYSTKPE